MLLKSSVLCHKAEVLKAFSSFMQEDTPWQQPEHSVERQSLTTAG